MGLVRFDRSVCMFVSSANTSMHMDALIYADTQAESLRQIGQEATDAQLVTWYLSRSAPFAGASSHRRCERQQRDGVEPMARDGRAGRGGDH